MPVKIDRFPQESSPEHENVDHSATPPEQEAENVQESIRD